MFEKVRDAGCCILTAQVICIGEDLMICVTGGSAHMGSVSIASEEESLVTKQFPHHRDAMLGDQFALAVQCRFGGKVTVVCGVHVDNITKEQINDILEAGQALLADVIIRLAQEKQIKLSSE